MKQFQSIRFQLFVCYAGIITITIIGLAAFFYFYTADILEEKASQSLQALASNIIISLDSEFRQMDEEANRVISSAPIKSIFYNPDFSSNNDTKNRSTLFNLLFTVTGSTMNYQINLFGNNGRLVQYGRTFDIVRQDAEKIFPAKWFEQCLKLEGTRHISSIHLNHAGYEVISVSRAFNEYFGASYDSIVEVQQYYRVFKNMILSALNEADSVKPYVYNNYGDLIYPVASGDGKARYNYFTMLDNTDALTGTLPILHGNAREIAAFSKSKTNGWVVVVCESEQKLLQSVIVFRNSILAIGVVVVLITLVITFVIARQLTIPIKKIRDSITRLNLKALHKESVLGETPSSNELELLYESYSEMVSRLQASLDDIVSIRSHEIQARMLALQSQMNPHFIYNTITIISILADNNHQPEIVRMCESLSGMLRYIVKDSPQPVTVAVELEYMDRYLTLMKYRYPEQFEVSVEIPEPLLNVPIPKLVIQPIIENCFKYAFDIYPPWSIRILGEISEDKWQITISDNGKGFDEGVLEWIQSRLREESFQFPQEAGEKTGLLNIFFRLKILYRKDAVFKIINNPSGGSTIAIGGLVQVEIAPEKQNHCSGGMD